MKSPTYKKLQAIPLLRLAKTFLHEGELCSSNQKYVYLKISNDYIEQLFPLLSTIDAKVQKPDYFSKYNNIGAHITVFYTQEHIQIAKNELGSIHQFNVQGLYEVLIEKKYYYVLLVKSASLTTLRKKYHLPNKLNFKGYAIDFHITIGIKS